MAIPPRPTLRDLNDDERVSLEDALGTSVGLPAKQGSDFTVADGVPIPKAHDLETPESAADWAQREIVRATPRAAQELIHQLRKGDSKSRYNAAMEILNRAGVQAKQGGGTSAPVIILTPKVIQQLPWLKREKLPPTVEGSVTKK